MNWEALGAVAELAGAIGVIASLLYLAVQIRQNTRSTKAAALHNTAQEMNQISLAMAADGSFSDIFLKGQDDLEGLSPEERMRVGFLWHAVFRATESLYYQYRSGNADKAAWTPYEQALEANLRSGGMRQWWRENSFPFTKEFTKLVDSKIESAEQEGKPYTWFGNVHTQ